MRYATSDWIHNQFATARLYASQGFGINTGLIFFSALGSPSVGRCPMSKVCQVTGKRPASGNNVSHANNRTRRRFLPNLHTHRFWVESENRFVRLKVSTKGMRIIDKKGIDTILAELRGRGEKI
jgi:large subunit ribosomal protein L28